MEKNFNIFQQIITQTNAPELVKAEFLARLRRGKLTRDEDAETHFGVYFAAFDSQVKQVFIGHHKKSGLWLFNGGHIDKDETPWQAVVREISEEWGKQIEFSEIKPAFLTVTPIEKNLKVACKIHYDIWYFFDFDKKKFKPDPLLLAKEFYQTGWRTFEEAKKLISDPQTLDAIRKLEKI